MILFTVTTDAVGDRALYLEGTQTLVGWVTQGRDFVDFNGNTWSEWGFEPQYHLDPVEGPFRAISGAYDAARAYAEKKGLA